MTQRPMPVSTQVNRLKDALKVVPAGRNDLGNQRGGKARRLHKWVLLGKAPTFVFKIQSGQREQTLGKLQRPEQGYLFDNFLGSELPTDGSTRRCWEARVFQKHRAGNREIRKNSSAPSARCLVGAFMWAKPRGERHASRVTA